MAIAPASRAESAPLPARDPWPRLWARRAVTIPTTFALLAVAVATAPIWIPLAALVDAVLPGRRCTLRCGLFLVLYLACEAAGIAACAGLWLRAVAPGGGGAGGARHLDGLFRLQNLWAGSLLHGAMRIFRIRIEAEGLEAARRPMLLFLRHASVADTLLAAELVSRPHGIRLRYVLKRELLWDPCLDLVGNRLPNRFVRRDSGDSEGEIRGVRALARGLRDDEGVLIYPEGTRFSRARRARVIARLRAGGHRELADRAERLRHTLPPRLGGPLALIEESPHLDVVFAVHTGFEGAASFWDLWNGALRDAVVRVRLWRVPSSAIPRDRSGRVEWLFENWTAMDAWLAAADAGGAPT